MTASAKSACTKMAPDLVRAFEQLPTRSLILDLAGTLPTQRGLIGLLLAVRPAAGTCLRTSYGNATRTPILREREELGLVLRVRSCAQRSKHDARRQHVRRSYPPREFRHVRALRVARSK